MQAGEARQIAERPSRAAVARRQRLRAGQQIRTRSRTGVASQREVAQIEAGDRRAEGDCHRIDRAVAWAGDGRDRRGRGGRIDGPGLRRVRGERVARGVEDARSARGERQRVIPFGSRQRSQITERVRYAAVARRQRLRAGQQVRAAVASQLQVTQIKAGDHFGERDRD